MQPVIWLDCDPGHDDAMAIIMACHGEGELLGVSTVSGNQTVEKTTVNAVKMLEICGKGDVVVIKGAGRPLLREAKHDPGIHGESGMEGSVIFNDFVLKKTRQSDTTKTPWLWDIAKRILESDRKVSVVATGALTNIALLVRTHPEVLKNISEISFMGGAMGIGNRHPVAEFNILCDPEAASIVVDLPVRIVMVPLEVTHTALVTEAVLKNMEVACKGSTLYTMVRQLMMFFASTYKREFGFAAPPLHDPCAVAAVTHPSLFTFKKMRVDVMTGDHPTAGQTVCDIWRYSDKKPNVHVATAVDVEGFFMLLTRSLAKCNETTPLAKM